MKFFALIIASAAAIKQDRKMSMPGIAGEAGPTPPPAYEEIPANDNSSAYGEGYTRVVPVQYREMRDDRLMNSLITQYAREVRVNGKLTGQMYLNKEDAAAVSAEVTRTSKKDIATAKTDFEGTWTHFDVNNDGLVEVERMPQFLRYLTNGALNPDL